LTIRFSRAGRLGETVPADGNSPYFIAWVSPLESVPPVDHKAAVTFHPRRNIPLLVLSAVVFGWVLALKIDLLFHHDDLLSPLALGSTAIGTLALPLGWLVREERRAVREKHARRRELFPPMEVIPIERFNKPPGYDPRGARHRVVIVRKRRVRRVQPLSPFLARRKALGLGAHWPRTGNQKCNRSWYRRIVW